MLRLFPLVFSERATAGSDRRGIDAARQARGYTFWNLAWLLACLIITSGQSNLRAEPPSGVASDELSELSLAHLRFGQEDYVDLFEAEEFVPQETREEGPRLRYRLFTPRNSEPGKKYPLIVWVHGYGDKETIDINRNTGQLTHTRLIFKNLESLKDYKFYFLAPQNQQSPDWFAKSAQDLPTHGEMLLELVDEIIGRHHIDPARVTIVGISSGGTSSWELAARRPDLFAGVAPLASMGGDLNRLQPLVGMPVWAFHTEGDNAGPEGDARAVEHLQSLGGCAQLTLNTGKEHDCWTAAFSKFGLLDWLLARRKGEACPFAEPTLAKNVLSKASSAAHHLPATITLLVMFVALAYLLRPSARLERLLKFIFSPRSKGIDP